MSKDTSELIFKKSINLCCQPIFSYISSLVIAPNAPFSQSPSQLLLIPEHTAWIYTYRCGFVESTNIGLSLAHPNYVTLILHSFYTLIILSHAFFYLITKNCISDSKIMERFYIGFTVNKRLLFVQYFWGVSYYTEGNDGRYRNN